MSDCETEQDVAGDEMIDADGCDHGFDAGLVEALYFDGADFDGADFDGADFDGDDQHVD